MKPDDRDAGVLGWWFAAEPRLPHGDGRAVVIGETLRVEPPLILCEHALHLSEHPADALEYARGALLYRVRGSVDVLRVKDKLGVSARTALAMRDATETLRADARASALSVIAAARDTVWYAARVETTAWGAAREAARAAARVAAARVAVGAEAEAAWEAAIEAHRQRLLDAVITLFGGAEALAKIDAGEARCSV